MNPAVVLRSVHCQRCSLPLPFLLSMATQPEKKLVQVWWAYCPLGDCKKGHSTLGKAYSEQRARQRIFDHVFGSPCHQATKEDAQALADAANDIDQTLVSDMVEEDAWDDKSEKQQQQQGHGKKRTRSWDNNSREGQELSTWSNVPKDLGNQIQTQTRNAFIFVKAL